jgi:hypothetical protein
MQLKTILIAMLMTALFAASSSAETPTTDTRSPVDLLLRATEVDDAAVGVAATRTREYQAFAQLYKAGKPSADAGKILVKATSPAARIYGYLTLRHVSPADAATAAPQLLQDQALVKVLSGCKGRESTVADLVARIQKGDNIIGLPVDSH